MMRVRRAAERGHGEHGWLETYHTFSFSDYYDPAHMGFRSLRVMNDDRVAPGAGFPMHSHRDMEIVTLVLEGQLEHKDSMGNGSVLRPGELQRMTAGTGIMHSEFNPSRTEPVHLYQIWLLPDRKGHTPGYEQKAFPESEKRGRWRLVASPDGRDGSLTIHQDALVLLADLDKGASLTYSFAPDRHGWLQVLRGGVRLNGTDLSGGDGCAMSDIDGFEIEATGTAEVMLFDLA
jgi:redox-sensitive bicupin YhaK (pirin superfamily)